MKPTPALTDEDIHEIDMLLAAVPQPFETVDAVLLDGYLAGVFLAGAGGAVTGWAAACLGAAAFLAAAFLAVALAFLAGVAMQSPAGRGCGGHAASLMPP